jgi:hypothetical protein
MPVGFAGGSGRYGGNQTTQRKQSNVVSPPGGTLLPGYEIKDGKLIKTAVKSTLPAPPPVGSGGGRGVVSVAPPKKEGTRTTPLQTSQALTGPSAMGTAGPAATSAIVPSARTTNPAAYQATGGPAGPGTAATPATNVSGSLATDSVTDRLNGFASRYDPSQINQIMDNPNIVLEDVLKSLGYPAGNTRMAEMGPYAENMLNLAGLLQMSGSLTGSDQADETMLNTIAELMSNGMGQGGQSVEYKTALDMLMNPQGGMDEYLFGVADDPTFGLSEQASALGPMFQAATAGVNPFTQRAMASAYRSAQNKAQQQLAHGEMQSDPRILNFLRSNLGGIIPGL